MWDNIPDWMNEAAERATREELFKALALVRWYAQGMRDDIPPDATPELLAARQYLDTLDQQLALLEQGAQAHYRQQEEG